MAAALSSVNARGNVACFTAKQSAQAPRRGQLQVRGRPKRRGQHPTLRRPPPCRRRALDRGAAAVPAFGSLQPADHQQQGFRHQGAQAPPQPAQGALTPRRPRAYKAGVCASACVCR